VKVPADNGIPEISPVVTGVVDPPVVVFTVNASPGGKVPISDHVSGGMPPLDAMVSL
jgi:hypothetical protein